MKQIVLGTAGHIDHGKTSLIKALTNIDTDRLKEEKERGITIDLGFAHLQLTPSLRLGFVDVPGHERFVKNMLAGVGGILITPITGVMVGGDLTFVVKAFTAALLGGLGDARGAIVGGVLLGLIESLSAAFISSGVQSGEALASSSL